MNRWPGDTRDGQILERKFSMNHRAFVSSVESSLRQAGLCVGDDGQVSLSVEALCQWLSQHNLEVVRQFIRLQRMAGVQTIQYADIPPDSIAALVERMADFDLVLDGDKAKARQYLREHVVDIRPVVDDRLYQLCNQHRSLGDFGLGGDR